MIKNWGKNYSCKTVFFLGRKLQFTNPYASIKDAQATGEAFGPQKRTSRTSKHENSLLFPTPYLWVIVALQDLDPDATTHIIM
jgi:hypothetical protein